MNGDYAIVGTYKVAHSAAHACMDRVCTLVYAVVNGKQIAWLFLQADGYLYGPFPMDSKLNSTNRANRSTPTAEGALFLIPEDYPGQIFYT
jgi:hypothetical protein